LPIRSVEAGIQIERNTEQPAKADFLTRESFDGDSNLTLESALQKAKQWPPSVSTVEGMQIDDNEEQLSKTSFSIRKSFDPTSNVTSEIRSEEAKQAALNTSIVRGTITLANAPKGRMRAIPLESTRKLQKIRK
jgi:hypothetical protein